MSWWQSDLEDGRLGDYRIDGKVGEGGMAEVFRCVGVAGVHRGRTVAIKVPRIGAVAPDDLAHYLRRFQREIELQNAEPIAHVVTMLGSGEITDKRGVRRPYLVMDYYGGGSLGAALGGRAGRRERTQSLEEVLRWLLPIAAALDDLHSSASMDVDVGGSARLHRDIKPDNILFSTRGRPFLSDFGVATSLSNQGNGSVLTGTGLRTPGSWGYSAPESLRGESMPASDQFSLAVTVYEALTGLLPVQVTTPEAYWAAMANWNPSLLHERCPEMPRAASHAVMRAISAKPADRFQSCSEFARAVADGARSPCPGTPAMGERPAATVAPPPVPKKGGQRWPWLAAAAVAVLAIVTYLIVLSSGASPAAVETTQVAQPVTPPPAPVRVEDAKSVPDQPLLPATGTSALEDTPPQAEQARQQLIASMPGANPAIDEGGRARVEGALPTTPSRQQTPATAVSTVFWVVLGTYGHAANADRVVAAALSRGIEVERELVTTNDRDVIRLRVGPWATRAQAEQARQQLIAAAPDVGPSIYESSGALPADPRNGGFIDQGNGLLLDTHTGLLWAQSDNGSDVDWNEANSYCQGKGMRLPSMAELRGIYDRPGSGTISCWGHLCKVSPLFRLEKPWPWSSERDGSDARLFDLSNGSQGSHSVSFSGHDRALCVRGS